MERKTGNHAAMFLNLELEHAKALGAPQESTHTGRDRWGEEDNSLSAFSAQLPSMVQNGRNASA